jgi:hypothetical protein
VIEYEFDFRARHDLKRQTAATFRTSLQSWQGRDYVDAAALVSEPVSGLITVP